ncbi:MAG: hypothetical protein M1839_006038 [Geoglossum umbratile]|nr:MAG: hypothetical protein M1839_006038 [Geoglossum umbratile]
MVKTTNTSLLNVLQPESEVLARIQGDFHTMLRTSLHQGWPALKITCFYEELPVRGIGEIVPKHSAILPAYNSIGIHANHMDMTKFSSDEDQGYLSVSTEILRWVRMIQKASQQASPAAPAQYAGMLPAPSSNIASPSNMGYLKQQQQPQALSTYQQPLYGGHSTEQQSAPMYGGQSLPPCEQGPQPQTNSSAPQVYQGANVISGNVNNFGGGKVIQGNNFQISSQGPVTF